MKKIILHFLALIISSSVFGIEHNCLPDTAKYKNELKGNYIIKTVKGDTYKEAERKLRTEIPHAGFQEIVRSTEIKVITNKNFAKARKVRRSIKANIDMAMKYECKYQGEYYITAVMAKKDIHYVDFEYPKEMKYKELKKTCGNKKVVLIMNANVGQTRVQADRDLSAFFGDPAKGNCSKIIRRFCEYEIICGEAKYKMGWKNKGRTGWTYIGDNRFDNFQAFTVEYKAFGPEVTDISLEMWLDITQDM